MSIFNREALTIIGENYPVIDVNQGNLNYSFNNAYHTIVYINAYSYHAD